MQYAIEGHAIICVNIYRTARMYKEKISVGLVS